jgi:putative CocE/NonD family hydrolase
MRQPKGPLRFFGVAPAAGLLVIGLESALPGMGASPTPVALSDLLPPSVTKCILPQAAPEADVVRRSFYVEAEDHTQLAVDVFTSAKTAQDTKVPTLFTATRYWRARDGAPLNELQRRWVAAGYAVVNADVRGTGASFGQWYIPYSPQEAQDLGFLANWIGRQPWSNGAVVMTGSSYPGTTSLLVTAYGSPAIKAVAPRFSDFDMYSDLLWPGGVVAEDLIAKWGKLVRGLDLNQPENDDGASLPSSVRPVDDPDGKALLLQAIEEHKRNPWSFDRAVQEVRFRDERSDHMHGMSINDGIVSNLDARIELSGVPIFGWGSWLDSGIAQGLLNRFMTLKNPQLTIIGPWTHGARANANVFDPNGSVEPPTAMQDQWNYCFLNNYANKTREPAPSHRIVYFTMGENRWKSTDVWPVKGTRPRRFFLESHKTLSEQPSARAALDSYQVDFDATTGPENRWATQVGTPRIDYGDRSEADARLLTYTSAPMGANLEITGQPVVTLNIMSNQTDGNFIVYLEDVSPDGRVTYLTEGGLRAIHRKLSKQPGPYKTTYPYRTYAVKDAMPLIPGGLATLVFQLQATSVRLEAGHRLRLAVAGADKGTFSPVPSPDHAVTVQVAYGGDSPSFIDVPEVP